MRTVTVLLVVALVTLAVSEWGGCGLPRHKRLVESGQLPQPYTIAIPSKTDMDTRTNCEGSRIYKDTGDRAMLGN